MNEEKNNHTDETKSETKKLKKSRKNKYIFGVCGGVAEYFEIDSSIVRILWVISIFIGGVGLAAYLVAAILMPKSEENEKEISKEKTVRKDNVGLLIVGGILIFLGLLSLLDQFRFVNLNLRWWNFDRFIYFPWDLIWPIVLIFLGIIIAVGRPKREEILQRVKGKNLFRSKTNRKISGVCGGLGEYLNIDSTIIRIAWVLVSILSGVILGIIVYFIFALIIPEKPVQEQ